MRKKLVIILISVIVIGLAFIILFLFIQNIFSNKENNLIGKVGTESLYANDLRKQTFYDAVFPTYYSFEEIARDSALLQYGATIDYINLEESFFNKSNKNSVVRKQILNKINDLLIKNVASYEFVLHTMYYSDKSSTLDLGQAKELLSSYVRAYEMSSGTSAEVVRLMKESAKLDSFNEKISLSRRYSNITLGNADAPHIYARYLFPLNTSDKSDIFTSSTNNSIQDSQIMISMISNVKISATDKTYSDYFMDYFQTLEKIVYETL